MKTRIITLVLLSVVTILFNSCIVRETEIVTSDDEMTEKYVGMTVEEVCRRIGEPEKRCSFIQDSIEITELTFRIVYSACLFAYAAMCIFIATTGIYNSFRWIIAPIVLTWILFFTWCKK